jgi:hypothetical protein
MSKIYHNTDLFELINDILPLNPTYGKNWMRFFEENQFLVKTPPQVAGTKYDGKIYIIKYLDCNSCWYKYARQCRGIIIMLDEASGRWFPIKYMLQRGSELLTGFHLKKGIEETQDMQKITKNSLSPTQQSLVRLLQIGSESELENTYLSMKTDGSLLCATIYSGNTADAIREIILEKGDDFAKVYLEMEKKTGKLIILSSQGTLFLPDQVKDYTVHAIMRALKLSEEQILEIAKIMKPEEALKNCCVPFFEEITRMYDRLQHQENHTSVSFCFETVVKNRRTAWGVLHTELAISYPDSSLKFLSGNICFGNRENTNVGNSVAKLAEDCEEILSKFEQNSQHGKNIVFTPHFNFPLGFNTIFLEPLWWKITNTTQINSMMEMLGQIIFGEISAQQFLERFPFSNTGFFDLLLDFEGFIIYTDNGEGGYEYNKLKTEPYYISHKFRPENIPTLIRISQNAKDIFPLSEYVKQIYTQLNDHLPNILKSINDELNMGEESYFFVGMPKKSQMSFLSKKPEVQRAMLINIGLDNDGIDFTEFCYESFCKKFKMLSSSEMKKTDVTGNIKRIVETYCKGSSIDLNVIRNDIRNIMDKKNLYLLNLIVACISTT